MQYSMFYLPKPNHIERNNLGESIKNILGFTILELIITIAIATTLIFAIMPGFTSYLANQHSATIATDLAASLRLARTNAITLGTNIQVCPSTDSKTCSGSNWAGGWIVINPNPVPPNPSILQVHAAVSPGTIGTCASNDTILVFTPVGKPQNQPNCTLNTQPSQCPTPPCNFGAFFTSYPKCTNGYQISVDTIGQIVVSMPLNCP